MIATKTERESDEWGWESHRVAQLRAALCMSPAERLAWLERTNASMRELLGLARSAGLSMTEPQ
ncbi:hypothetical protein ENSA5_47100 [Enhygromyxa salina]|uniref:Uncharacterized protein n=1 Tax=Enhygromyxa salina TaxID=215803 RepID=A0A2S9XIY1_9BACT|nr:hypothetical protein ENSA5_47100 [Enhygromyxa salina]